MTLIEVKKKRKFLDPTIVCCKCGKLLRDDYGQDIEDIHTNSEGEDVCEDCCDVCGNGFCDVCDMPLSKSDTALHESVCQNCLQHEVEAAA